MRNTYGNTNRTLVALAGRAIGLHYNSPEAKAILDEEDWANHWPVVDADGLLTGDVVETDDKDYWNVEDTDDKDYWNVEDMAMISNDDLRPAQREGICDGYVRLF